MSLRNISKYFSVNNMKKNGLNEYVYQFSVDYNCSGFFIFHLEILKLFERKIWGLPSKTSPFRRTEDRFKGISINDWRRHSTPIFVTAVPQNRGKTRNETICYDDVYLYSRFSKPVPG